MPCLTCHAQRAVSELHVPDFESWVKVQCPTEGTTHKFQRSSCGVGSEEKDRVANLLPL